MAQSGQRKCLCCKLFFDPDHRNREHQRYCSQPECRRASKTASQAAWLAQPDNHDYFRGPEHVVRVQAWRAAHPGYSRGKRRKPAPLQDGLFTQVNDSIEETAIRGESAGTALLQGFVNHIPLRVSEFHRLKTHQQNVEHDFELLVAGTEAAHGKSRVEQVRLVQVNLIQ